MARLSIFAVSSSTLHPFRLRFTPERNGIRVALVVIQPRELARQRAAAVPSADHFLDRHVAPVRDLDLALHRLQGAELRDAGEVEAHRNGRNERRNGGEGTVGERFAVLGAGSELGVGEQGGGGEIEADFLLQGRIGRLNVEIVVEHVFGGLLLHGNESVWLPE